MSGFKSHFVFNRSERNGIFVLVALILLAQVVYFMARPASEGELEDFELEEMSGFQRQIDSLKTLAAIRDSAQVYKFNPNFMSDYRGYQLGLTLEEIDRLQAFRAKDQWVNSAEDFQQVTGISDSLLKVISPSFRFPDWVRRGADEQAARQAAPKYRIPVKDLNQATAQELRQVYGIGEVLSSRIISYRESLGGFLDNSQLYEVYGLDSAVVERTLESFQVKDPPQVERHDLNRISLLELSEVPGVGYELARKIIAYREQHRRISSFDELLKIPNFPGEKINRIKLYLAIHEERETVE